MRNAVFSLLLSLVLAVLPFAETAAAASAGAGAACMNDMGGKAVPAMGGKAVPAMGGKAVPAQSTCLTCCILPASANVIAAPADRRVALPMAPPAPLAGIEPAATSPPPRTLG